VVTFLLGVVVGLSVAWARMSVRRAWTAGALRLAYEASVQSLVVMMRADAERILAEERRSKAATDALSTPLARCWVAGGSPLMH
jgi:hypothetical protein